MSMSGQHHFLAKLPLTEEITWPAIRKTEETLELFRTSERKEQIFAAVGNRIPILRPHSTRPSHCTDWATPALWKCFKQNDWSVRWDWSVSFRIQNGAESETLGPKVCKVGRDWRKLQTRSFMVSMITMNKYRECDGRGIWFLWSKNPKSAFERPSGRCKYSFKMDIIELWVQNTGFIWTRTGRLHVTISFEEASGNSVSVNRKEIIDWLKKMVMYDTWGFKL